MSTEESHPGEASSPTRNHPRTVSLGSGMSMSMPLSPSFLSSNSSSLSASTAVVEPSPLSEVFALDAILHQHINSGPTRKKTLQLLKSTKLLNQLRESSACAEAALKRPGGCSDVQFLHEKLLPMMTKILCIILTPQQPSSSQFVSGALENVSGELEIKSFRMFLSHITVMVSNPPPELDLFGCAHEQKKWEDVCHNMELSKESSYCIGTMEFLVSVSERVKKLDFNSGGHAVLVAMVVRALAHAWRGLTSCGIFGCISQDVRRGEANSRGRGNEGRSNGMAPNSERGKAAPPESSESLLDFDAFSPVEDKSKNILFGSPFEDHTLIEAMALPPPTAAMGKREHEDRGGLAPKRIEFSLIPKHGQATVIADKNLALALSVPSSTIFAFARTVISYLPQEQGKEENNHDKKRAVKKKKGIFGIGKGKGHELSAPFVAPILSACKGEVYMSLEIIVKTIGDGISVEGGGAEGGRKDANKFARSVRETLDIEDLSDFCSAIWRGVENGANGAWKCVKELLKVRGQQCGDQRNKMLGQFSEFVTARMKLSNLDAFLGNEEARDGLVFLCCEILHEDAGQDKGWSGEVFKVVERIIREGLGDFGSTTLANRWRVSLRGIEMVCSEEGYKGFARNGAGKKVVETCVKTLENIIKEEGENVNAHVHSRGRGGEDVGVDDNENEGAGDEIMKYVGKAVQRLGKFAAANGLLIAEEAEGGVTDLLSTLAITEKEEEDRLLRSWSSYSEFWGRLITKLSECCGYGTVKEVECLKALMWLALNPKLDRAGLWAVIIEKLNQMVECGSVRPEVIQDVAEELMERAGILGGLDVLNTALNFMEGAALRNPAVVEFRQPLFKLWRFCVSWEGTGELQTREIALRSVFKVCDHSLTRRGWEDMRGKAKASFEAFRDNLNCLHCDTLVFLAEIFGKFFGEGDKDREIRGVGLFGDSALNNNMQDLDRGRYWSGAKKSIVARLMHACIMNGTSTDGGRASRFAALEALERIAEAVGGGIDLDTKSAVAECLQDALNAPDSDVAMRERCRAGLLALGQ